MIHLQGLDVEVTWDGETLHVRGVWGEGGSYVDDRYEPHTSARGERGVSRADIADARLVRPIGHWDNGSVVIRTPQNRQMHVFFKWHQESAFAELLSAINESAG